MLFLTSALLVRPPLVRPPLLVRPPAPRARSAAAMALEDSPVVIVPGFGNADIDYKTPLGQDADVGLESVLARRGFTDVRTMPCERFEWARVILGLLAAIVWRPWATPEGPAYSWFIDRLRGAVEEAHAQSGGKKVLLVAHSAGGWLSRAALSDGGAWRGGAAAPAELVSGLVTLGAAHFPPPEGTPDMTQGVIRAVNDDYPGAFLAREGIAYVTVGGDAIVGDDSKAQSPAAASVDNVYAMRGEGSAARVAFNSYLMTCGRGDVTGDGVVPLEWTLLEGARQVVLPGVLHSINEAGTTLPTDRWYGSEQVVDRWLGAVRQEVAAETTNPLEEAVSQMRRLVGLDAL